MLTIRSMMREQVRIVLEHDVRFLEPAFSFDVNLVVAVDENVRDVGIREQRLERTQPEDLVQNVDDDRIALEQAEGSRSGSRDPGDR